MKTLSNVFGSLFINDSNLLSELIPFLSLVPLPLPLILLKSYIEFFGGKSFPNPSPLLLPLPSSLISSIVLSPPIKLSSILDKSPIELSNKLAILVFLSNNDPLVPLPLPLVTRRFKFDPNDNKLNCPLSLSSLDIIKSPPFKSLLLDLFLPFLFLFLELSLLI